MDPFLFAEQGLNGLQLGAMLFLMAAGLTLVFGIMNFVNLAHGSLYMMGAFAAASALRVSDSFALAVAAGVAAATVTGLVVEWAALRRLYPRSHLDQVLGTFGLLLFFNEAARIVWGSSPLYMSTPAALSGFASIFPSAGYPVYRLVIIAVGFAVAAGLFALIGRTRLGMHIRAGASNREMMGALGVDTTRLFALVFAIGGGLAGLAGAITAPVVSVQIGMGEPILILAFVVIVVGGLGSIRGALVGALLVGLIDTYGRFLLPQLFGFTLGPALSSMAIYLLMAVTLAFRPQGIFPAPASSGGEAPQDHPSPPMPRLRILAIGAAVLVLLAVPALGETYYTRLITRILIFGLAALSLDIIFGFGGMVSFGHAAFLGIGAYAVGILAANGISSAALAWPAAVILSAIAAIAIGAISLKTSGIFFIMITLAFGQMLYFVAVGLDRYGGDDGLPLRAHSTLGDALQFRNPVTLYYSALVLLVAAIVLSHGLLRSSFGLALRGIRDNERRMRAIGFETYRYRLTAFAVAGGMCGLAGALLVNVDAYVGPSTLHWFVSGELMIMVILGGAATLIGPVVGAGTYLLLKELLSGWTEHWLVVFGPLLVVFVLVARGGLYTALLAHFRRDA